MTPTEEVCLAARQESIEPSALVRRLVTEHLPAAGEAMEPAPSRAPEAVRSGKTFTQIVTPLHEDLPALE